MEKTRKLSIMERLAADKEIEEIYLKWKAQNRGEFLLFNTDDFGGIEDYKTVLRWCLKHPEWEPSPGHWRPTYEEMKNG